MAAKRWGGGRRGREGEDVPAFWAVGTAAESSLSVMVQLSV
jgi:hypothetical protein